MPQWSYAHSRTFARPAELDEVRRLHYLPELDTMLLGGNLVAEKALGEIGLLDIVESVNATRRANGEYVVFLEDDYESKVVMFRWRAP